MVEPAEGVEPLRRAGRRDPRVLLAPGWPSSRRPSRSTSPTPCPGTRTASSTSASCATPTGRGARRSDRAGRRHRASGRVASGPGRDSRWSMTTAPAELLHPESARRAAQPRRSVEAARPGRWSTASTATARSYAVRRQPLERRRRGAPVRRPLPSCPGARYRVASCPVVGPEVGVAGRADVGEPDHRPRRARPPPPARRSVGRGSGPRSPSAPVHRQRRRARPGAAGPGRPPATRPRAPRPSPGIVRPGVTQGRTGGHRRPRPSVGRRLRRQAGVARHVGRPPRPDCASARMALHDRRVGVLGVAARRWPGSAPGRTSMNSPSASAVSTSLVVDPGPGEDLATVPAGQPGLDAQAGPAAGWACGSGR